MSRLELTREMEFKMPAPRMTEGENVKEIIVKFGQPSSFKSWFVVEGEQIDNGDWCFYGLVKGLEIKWDYFYLSELSNPREYFNYPVEIDKDFIGKIVGDEIMEGDQDDEN